MRPAMTTSTLARYLVPLTLGLLLCFDARAAGGDEAFSRDAALSSLSSVDVAKCKLKKGPTGEGHVIVTFASTGSAQGAVLDQGPFGGTKAEKCIVKEYRRAKVPAFKGDPVSVGKKFKIE
jgi:hypothetical protein